MSEHFGKDVEALRVKAARHALKTDRYFHRVYHPRAFQIGGDYVLGLTALAHRFGMRAFETRRLSHAASLRVTHLVLAGIWARRCTVFR